jgi:Fe2+ or Zn2+ uptake regulation protein
MEEDKKMLKEAFKALGRYSKNQCRVFDALVDITVDDVTYFSINNMSKQINVTRPTIYNTLKVLQKDGILFEQGKIGTYKFNQETLELIINFYKKQQGLDTCKKL